MKPIAIIGMSSIFPHAKDITQYWDNILGEINCITEVPASRWDINDYFDPNPNVPDKSYSKYGGFIPDIDFDPVEFGLPPNILEVTDVSQLLSLIVARDALSDAGYIDAKEEILDMTGVVLGFVGMSSKLFSPLLSRLQYPVWEKVLMNSGINKEDTQKIVEKIKLAYVGWNENAFPGAIGNVISGRIANRFNLGGTSCVVDAACASSLSATKIAISELLEGRADMMITGGVDTDNSILTFMCFSKTPAFSKGDRVRAFDAESDGMLVGEGVGMLVLKRLEDAERDNDRIYAVIKGIGTSSDGRYKSIYAPRASGQAKSLRRAYEDAGFLLDTVGLIEAHGTGTMAGDPAEFEGLREVFDLEGLTRQTIALGSVKSQIGHTKAAAGAASLIKTALALHHKILPATINISKPDPEMEIENTPFYLNTETRPWMRKSPGVPRRAGVSSFGFGGTNFHIVLEEYQNDHEKPYRLQSIPNTVLLFASSPDQLLENCEALLVKLNGIDGQHHLNEQNISSKTASIPNEAARLGFISRSLVEAQEYLRIAIDFLKQKPQDEEWEHPKGIFYRKMGIDPQGKVVVLFPGQGSQYINMGKELAINFPTIRSTFSQMDLLFTSNKENPLSATIYPIPVFDNDHRKTQKMSLTLTQHAQPAIGSFSMGLFKLLDNSGFRPDFIAGHSFGELTALWASGVLNDKDYLKLAKARGNAMTAPEDPNFDSGTMLAVKGNIETVQEEVKQYPNVTVANQNSKTQIVLAGSRQAIDKIKQVLANKGYTVVFLPVSAAFHTSLVGYAKKPFAKAINKANFNKPTIPVYSNTTGLEYDHEPENIRKTLANHILNPVLFKKEIETIYDQGGSIFIEIGPKNVLSKLVDDILEGIPHISIALNPNAKKDSDWQFRLAVLQMRIIGLHLGNVDPFKISQNMPSSLKKSKVCVTLNGGMYITERTHSAFEEALRDGFKVNLHANQTSTANPENTQEISISSSENSSKPQTNTIKGLMTEEKTSIISSENNSIEKHLTEFQVHQNSVLHVHEQYLQNDMQFINIFRELANMELSFVSKGNANSLDPRMDQLVSNLENNMTHLHENQTRTTRVHEQYLKSQMEFSKNFSDLLRSYLEQSLNGIPLSMAAQTHSQRPQPFSSEQNRREIDLETMPSAEQQPAHMESSSANETSTNLDNLAVGLLEIVCEKTGYPTEMLKMEMDMEADLGIDSIKRVEILSAMQAQFPELPSIEPEELAELRTLGQIVEKLGSTKSNNRADQTAILQVNSTPIINEVVTENGAKPDENILTKTLLKTVSEKTGYPTEMLEMEMDMEADLGIDSIKRVEILSAMQAQFPELPSIEPEELAELRTLGQIVEKLGATKPIEQKDQVQDENIQNTHFEDMPGIQKSTVALKQLPIPDQIDFKLPEGSICLLTNDGTENTPALAQSLTEKGWKVVVLSFPKAIVSTSVSLPENILQVNLNVLSEKNLQTQIEKITNREGPISAFIHLNPILKENNSDPEKKIHFSDSQRTILKHIFLLSKQLKPSLVAASEKSRGIFITVTHLDGHLGLGENFNNDPVCGGYFGLVKTLNLEWNGVFCRAIDISLELDSESLVHSILAEIFDPNCLITEVGISPLGRKTICLENSMRFEIEK